MKQLTLIAIVFILGVLTGSYYKPKECKSTTDYNNSIEGSIEDRSIYQYSYR